MHPRLTPGNDRVAHSSLRGQVVADRFTDGTRQQIAAPVADLLRGPDGALDRQLLRGADFLLLEADTNTGYGFGQSVLDGYVGYLRLDQLQDLTACSHQVTALASHCYPTANMKTRPLACLSFGARVTVTGKDGSFLALDDGSYMPSQHLRPIDWIAPDFVALFEAFTGIPYLWGGNSTQGMDCSGAVQMVLEAVDIPCSRDTDMQEATLGTLLPDDAPLARGDLVFWDGHVGMMRDAETLIHANAHHMAVASEPLAGAIDRIIANGGGKVTARKRL